MRDVVFLTMAVSFSVVLVSSVYPLHSYKTNVALMAVGGIILFVAVIAWLWLL